MVAVTVHPYGAAKQLLSCRDKEALIEGPAGTGKSFMALWKVHLALLKYRGARALMVRKTAVSLTATALVTYRERVLGADRGHFGVTFYGGSRAEPAQFRYPNGSSINLGGMDKPTKIMSSEYDLAYVNEATELEQDDWESITTRLRYGAMPYQQLLADCNPSSPSHWLNQRCNAGTTTRLLSRHEDNPALYDHAAGQWTEKGAAYIATLDQLTGVRLERLRYGKWAAAEGIVYDGWDAARHIIDRFPIPDDWPRYLCVDFGFVNPFVCQWWAEDHDGRLYRYREIYRTNRLVEDHAADIKRLMALDKRQDGSPIKPSAVITDHDAEDRATLERHLGLRTIGAKKDISPGIQAVATRLKDAGDGKPRLFFLRDSLVERDRELAGRGLPACTEEELDGYVWDMNTTGTKGPKDLPLKLNDHGADATRYMTAHKDLRKRSTVLVVD